jgi:hypothetical protein
MDDKWNIKNKKKGFLKIHDTINVKTKEILALEITYKKVYDAKIMKKLVRHIINNVNKKKIKESNQYWQMGIYDSNENFIFFNEKRIQLVIRVKRN